MKYFIPLKIKRFLRQERGTTAVEFAIVANVFFLLSMGILEFGFVNYMKVAVQSVALNAGRYASIGAIPSGCSDTACAVQKFVEQETAGFVKSENVHVDSRVLGSASDAAPPTPDVCLKDPNDPYPPDCKTQSGVPGYFIDKNGNGIYDGPSALTSGNLGNPGDLVEVRITYVWYTLFPYMSRFFHDDAYKQRANGETQKDTDGQIVKHGEEGFITITSTAIFRNEPPVQP